jgi:hypothetical protein
MPHLPIDSLRYQLMATSMLIRYDVGEVARGMYHRHGTNVLSSNGKEYSDGGDK